MIWDIPKRKSRLFICDGGSIFNFVSYTRCYFVMQSAADVEAELNEKSLELEVMQNIYTFKKKKLYLFHMLKMLVDIQLIRC